LTIATASGGRPNSYQAGRARFRRSTGVAILYNTPVMLFGGLAPFYISLVARFTDARFIPSSHLFGAVPL